MAEFWTPTFPDVTGWIDETRDGSATPGASSLTLATPTPSSILWRGAPPGPAGQTPCIFRFPFVSMGLSAVDTLLIFYVDLISSTVSAGVEAGLILYKSVSEGTSVCYDCGSSTPNFTMIGYNYWTPIYTLRGGHVEATLPIRMAICWNNTLVVQTTPMGDTLAAGYQSCYSSTDAGTTWSPRIDQRAMPYTPDSIGLYLAASAEDVVTSVVFGNVNAEAPLLGCSDSIIIPADPIVTGGFINNQAKNFSAEYQTNAGCRTFVVPFLYGSAGKSVRKRITAPSSSLG